MIVRNSISVRRAMDCVTRSNGGKISIPVEAVRWNADRVTHPEAGDILLGTRFSSGCGQQLESQNKHVRLLVRNEGEKLAMTRRGNTRLHVKRRNSAIRAE